MSLSFQTFVHEETNFPDVISFPVFLSFAIYEKVVLRKISFPKLISLENGVISRQVQSRGSNNNITPRLTIKKPSMFPFNPPSVCEVPIINFSPFHIHPSRYKKRRGRGECGAQRVSRIQPDPGSTLIESAAFEEGGFLTKDTSKNATPSQNNI